MKIAWVTPLHPRSAIGRFSRFVRPALQRAGHEVTLVRCESPELLAEPGADVAVDCISCSNLVEAESAASAFDIVIYNAGDNFPFHAGIIELLGRFPGAVIFHDAYLLNLYLAWRRSIGGADSPDVLLDQIHGAGASAVVASALTKPDFLTATQSYTMLAWLARQADGAVAHARFYEQPLREACAGPVRVIPLAYGVLEKIPALPERRDASNFRMLTFGHVNSNRRVEAVLRVMGTSPVLRESGRYRVVGPIEKREQRRLETVASEAGVTAVEFAGRVSDAELREELAAADVICALRWPALEGASGSVIEAMRSGRPVIVTDTGCYRDLPTELVFKVNPENELEDLRDHLELLARDCSIGVRVGQAAARWADTAFSAEAYVNQLTPFLDEVIEAQPLLRTMEHVGENLAELGLRRDDPAVARIAAAMDQLFLSATPHVPGEPEQQTVNERGCT